MTCAAPLQVPLWSFFASFQLPRPLPALHRRDLCCSTALGALPAALPAWLIQGSAGTGGTHNFGALHKVSLMWKYRIK